MQNLQNQMALGHVGSALLAGRGRSRGCNTNAGVARRCHRGWRRWQERLHCRCEISISKYMGEWDNDFRTIIYFVYLCIVMFFK